MTLFDSDVVGIIGDLLSGPVKGCKNCYEEADVEIEMEPTQTYHPKLCGYVDAWECSRCERVVIREDLPDGSARISQMDPEDVDTSTSRAPSGWWREEE